MIDVQDRDLQMAIRLLEESSDTFVAVRDEAFIYRSKERGVSPVFAAKAENIPLFGAAVADRVIGRGMALLLAGEGVCLVYGQTVSAPAKAFLEDRGMFAGAGREVPVIVNRTEDGLCPLEAATMEICDPDKALDVIEAIRREIMRQGHE